jgi:hypothetical protein
MPNLSLPAPSQNFHEKAFIVCDDFGDVSNQRNELLPRKHT